MGQVRIFLMAAGHLVSPGPVPLIHSSQHARDQLCLQNEKQSRVSGDDSTDEHPQGSNG